MIDAFSRAWHFHRTIFMFFLIKTDCPRCDRGKYQRRTDYFRWTLCVILTFSLLLLFNLDFMMCRRHVCTQFWFIEQLSNSSSDLCSSPSLFHTLTERMETIFAVRLLAIRSMSWEFVKYINGWWPIPDGNRFFVPKEWKISPRWILLFSQSKTTTRKTWIQSHEIIWRIFIIQWMTA